MYSRAVSSATSPFSTRSAIARETTSHNSVFSCALYGWVVFFIAFLGASDLRAIVVCHRSELRESFDRCDQKHPNGRGAGGRSAIYYHADRDNLDRRGVLSILAQSLVDSC